MNKARRKQIQIAIQQIEALVQTILDDEQEAYDNMPEGLQESENGLISADAHRKAWIMPLMHWKKL